MKHTFLYLCLTAALTIFGKGAAIADNQITYALGDGTEAYGTGGKNAETYDLALHIKDVALVGAKIKAVRIAFPSTENLSNAKAWLSTELPEIKSGKAGEPNITSKTFGLGQGYIQVTFNEPYTITEEGVYVGYSFDAAKATEALRPVLVTSSSTPEGCYIHSTKVFRTAWRQQMSNDLAMQVILEGDVLKNNAASVNQLPELNTKVGTATAVTFQVTNHGMAGATTIDYDINVNGQNTSKKVKTTLRGIYGDRVDVSTNLPAITQKGAYDYTITVTKVNGVDNEDVAPAASGRVNVYNTLPKHRAVLEEYTGLWCGYCPRGFVGLEEMNRLYPNDFIGISYHDGDDMEILSSNNYPWNEQKLGSFPGYPAASLDRVSSTDAFCGDEAYGSFGINKAWAKRCKVFAPAAVELESEWTDDNTLHATAYITFPLANEKCPYRVGFALIADGLCDEFWAQSNYYTGEQGWPASMNPFIQGGSYIYDLSFNDVIIEASAVRGIEGSLSAPIEEDVAQLVTYDFDISKIKEKIVPTNRSKLRVVALLIHDSGEIVNANKAQAGSCSTDIQAVTSADERPSSVRYFDLQGRPVAQPVRGGMFIKSETLQNGKVRSQKVLAQ